MVAPLESEHSNNQPIETDGQEVLSSPADLPTSDVEVNSPENVSTGIPVVEPDTSTETIYSAKKRSLGKRALAVVGGAAVVVAGLGVARAVSGNSDSTKNPTPAAESGTLNPETDSSTGNIRVTAIAPGSQTFEVQRPNGETIKVPSLENVDLTSDSAKGQYMNNVFAEMSAYFSTGDQTVIDAMTSNQKLQNLLKDFKDQHFGYTHSATDTANWQAVVFDNPENPAKYTTGSDSGGQYIQLSDGEVYLNYGSDATYGSPKMHDANPTLAYNYRFSNFKIYVNQSTGMVTDMIWQTNNK